MENAVEALKMAGAAMLFVLAFSIAMFMFNKARTTTDAVLDNLKIGDFFTRVNPLENNETRKVGIETIIPTLYRYHQQDANITIKILDNNDTELQVFDTTIESIAQNDFKASNASDQPYYNELKKKYGDSSKKAYLFGAPWNNQEKNPYYIERINSYIYGTKSVHMKTLDYSNNNLMNYKDKTFSEKYLEYRTSGHVEIDEYGEEIVTVPASTKTIITYKIIN